MLLLLRTPVQSTGLVPLRHGKRGLRGYGTRVTVVGRTNGNVEGCV